MSNCTDISFIPAIALLTISCTADTRPALTEAQFQDIRVTCSLSDKARFVPQSDSPPRIALGPSDTEVQAKCVRAEQDRIGAIADMAK